MSSGKGDSNHKASPFDALLKNKGNDCDRPACEDTMSALSNALNRLNAAKGNNKHQQQQAQDTTSTTKSSKNVKQGGDVEIIQTSCPPSKDQIGKSSWTLLHSMAAWYPEKPNVEEQQKMNQFMEALSLFYPCTYCADDFQINLRKSPVQSQSRKDLCSWLCQQHNIVNEKLGKPLFDCSMKNLDERWRKSSKPECNNRQ